MILERSVQARFLVPMAVSLGFGVLLVIAGYDYVEGTLGVVSAAIGFPIELLHLAAPVCGMLIVVHAAARLLGAESET